MGKIPYKYFYVLKKSNMIATEKMEYRDIWIELEERYIPVKFIALPLTLLLYSTMKLINTRRQTIKSSIFLLGNFLETHHDYFESAIINDHAIY